MDPKFAELAPELRRIYETTSFAGGAKITEHQVEQATTSTMLFGEAADVAQADNPVDIRS